MRKIIETDDIEGTLESLLGKRVRLFCVNYIYAGVLSGLTETTVILKHPGIVYETGPLDDPGHKNFQEFKADQWSVRIDSIESFGEHA